MKNNVDHIKDIIGSIDINMQKQILLNGKTFTTFKQDKYITEPSGKMLFDELQCIIYRQFYIQPCKTNLKEPPLKKELEKNINLLSKANQGKEIFDEGWTVEENKNDELLTARKGNKLIQLVPGEYLNIPNGNHRNRKREVRVYRPKEYGDPDDIFYYAFGSAVDQSRNEETVRFYFNASFAGNLQWMKLLTGSLNEFSIPFVFKCLIHPYYYNRSDTAVLYCNKQHAAFAADLISSEYKKFKKNIRPVLPLFVYPFMKGIGFAEQPLNENESFGTHWSKLIAAGMMKAYEANLPKEKWMNEVIKHISNNHGYTSPDKFYKNPGSKYPYPFIKE